MFWLRWIGFSAPLVLGLGGVWLYQSIAGLRLEPEGGALVHALSGPVGPLNPLVPAEGIEGEIADLVFEPLLRRDGDLRLRPNLIEGWSSRTVTTLLCESEEAAGEVEARIRSGEAPAKGPRPRALERAGSLVTVAFGSADPGLEGPLLDAIPPDLLAEGRLVRIRADHSIEALVSAWMGVSRQKERVRMLEFSNGQVADLYLEAPVEPAVEELGRFLGANTATRPKLEELGRVVHHSRREMLLELREDVRWHDGTPFTAGDVTFSYRFLTGPQSPLPLGRHFDFASSVEVVTPHRLRVVCRETPATMLESWERLPVLPAHLLEGKMEDDPAGAFASFFQFPIGLGPYRLERRRPDGGVELRAHSSYHRGVPRETLRRYRPFPSLESTLLALRVGGIHAIEPEARFSDWVSRHPGLVETLRDVPRFQHLVIWNLRRPPFDREAVRQALARAVDLGGILEDSATVYEAPVTGLFRAGSGFVTEPMLLPLYDPRGAERLLDREGFSRDEGTGLRSGPGGKPLGFRLSVSSTNPEHLRLARALAEQWSSLGLEVSIDAADWGELLGDRLPRRDFDAVMVTWEIPLGRDRREVWHSDAAGPGGGNLSGLRDPEIDRLLEVLRSASDPAHLMECAAALQRLVAERQPCLFLCETARRVTLRSGALSQLAPGAPEGGEIRPGKGGLAESRPWWVRTAPESSPP